MHPRPRSFLEFQGQKTSSSPVELEPSPIPTAWVAARVTGMVMVHALTGKDITWEFGIIAISEMDEPFTFVALTEGPVRELRFFLDNTWIRTEIEAPYSFWGDYRGDYNEWPEPIFGQWIIIRAEATGWDGSKNSKSFRMFLERETDKS